VIRGLAARRLVPGGSGRGGPVRSRTVPGVAGCCTLTRRGAAEDRPLHFLPQGQVPPGHVRHRADGVLGHDLLQLPTELLLLLAEGRETPLQEVGRHPLYRVAVEPDDLGQGGDGEDGVSARFVLRDDLKQDAAGEVLVGLRIAHHELHPVVDQLAHVLERDVPAP
jgi:hypothetical protein